MKKILYLTSIPWAWIKQRPQFLAEYLSNDYEVTYCFKRPTVIKKKDLKINDTDLHSDNLKFKSFRIFPLGAIPIIRRLNLDWINKLLLKFQVQNLQKYDIIWITSASLYDLLPNNIKCQSNIVYDCMDDLLEFPTVKCSETRKTVLMEKENRLLTQSTVVISSADYLKDKVIARSGISPNKVYVVNNAVELPKSDINRTVPDEVCDAITKIKSIKLSMVYIGTIDDWFDFDSVNYVLNKIQDLELVLFGPSRCNIPENSKIHHLGTIQRDYIFNVMEAADILVMPFKLNELIRSVNPVKLYEYIYAGKHVIATRYGETQKFEKYVHLYENHCEMYSIVKDIMNGSYLTNPKEGQEFVENNTWLSRYEVVKKILDENLKI